MNALILTVSAGYGHISVSNALKEYLESHGETVEIFDILKDVNPIINTVFTEYYLKAIKYIPDVYSFLYKKEAEKAINSPRKFKRSTKKLKQKIQKEELTVTDIFNRVIIKKKLMSILKNQKPDFIICTHPFIGELLELEEISEYAKSPKGLNACILTVVTDYVVHPSWLNTASDYFIFASDRLRYFLNEIKPELLAEDKAKFLGIPIKSIFNEPFDKKLLKEKYGLYDSFTYLVMGGGYGIGSIKENVKLLIQSEIDNFVKSNIIVICGNNEELYESISTIKKKLDKNNQIKILKFIDYIDELMKLSDVIITKPGGISITEAMACKLPIVIREYLPGQEERNTEFLLNNNLGILAQNDLSFLSYINQLKEDEEYRTQIIENQSKIYNTDTLKNIYSLMKQEQRKKENI